jgi:hypothetical protein
MLFVILSNSKNGTCKERVARRIQWKNPEGTNLIAEYWLTTEYPNVIQIVETDNVQLLLNAIAEWDDVFDISIYPAITGEVGMINAQEMMKNL